MKLKSMRHEMTVFPAIFYAFSINERVDILLFHFLSVCASVDSRSKNGKFPWFSVGFPMFQEYKQTFMEKNLHNDMRLQYFYINIKAKNSLTFHRIECFE